MKFDTDELASEYATDNYFRTRQAGGEWVFEVNVVQWPDTADAATPVAQRAGAGSTNKSGAV